MSVVVIGAGIAAAVVHAVVGRSIVLPRAMVAKRLFGVALAPVAPGVRLLLTGAWYLGTLGVPGLSALMAGPWWVDSPARFYIVLFPILLVAPSMQILMAVMMDRFIPKQPPSTPLRAVVAWVCLLVLLAAAWVAAE